MEIKCHDCDYTFKARKEQTNKKRQCPKCYSYDLTENLITSQEDIETKIKKTATVHITEKYSTFATSIGMNIANKYGSDLDYDVSKMEHRLDIWKETYTLMKRHFYDNEQEVEEVSFFRNSLVQLKEELQTCKNKLIEKDSMISIPYETFYRLASLLTEEDREWLLNSPSVDEMSRFSNWWKSKK